MNNKELRMNNKELRMNNKIKYIAVGAITLTMIGISSPQKNVFAGTVKDPAVLAARPTAMALQKANQQADAQRQSALNGKVSTTPSLDPKFVKIGPQIKLQQQINQSNNIISKQSSAPTVTPTTTTPITTTPTTTTPTTTTPTTTTPTTTTPTTTTPTTTPPTTTTPTTTTPTTTTPTTTTPTTTTPTTTTPTTTTPTTTTPTTTTPTTTTPTTTTPTTTTPTTTTPTTTTLSASVKKLVLDSNEKALDLTATVVNENKSNFSRNRRNNLSDNLQNNDENFSSVRGVAKQEKNKALLVFGGLLVISGVATNLKNNKKKKIV